MDRVIRVALTTFCLLIAAVAAFGPLPALADPVALGSEHCVVNVRADDQLNIRTGPGSRYPALGGLRYGQCGVIVVADCQGDWCPIEDGHYAGYVHRHYISMVSPARYCVTGVAWADVLNLRAYPAAASRIVLGIPSNACAIALLPYATTGWQKVRFSGFEGWVNRSFLTGQ